MLVPALHREVRDARGIRRIAAALMLVVIVGSAAALVVTVIAQVALPLAAWLG